MASGASAEEITDSLILERLVSTRPQCVSQRLMAQTEVVVSLLVGSQVHRCRRRVERQWQGLAISRKETFRPGRTGDGKGVEAAQSRRQAGELSLGAGAVLLQTVSG